MAKKLSDFIKNLIVKAGGNVEDEKIKTALAAVVDAELGDELATTIDNGLISMEQAKNNHPDIKKHYTALALNGLDTELDRLMEDEKLSEEIVAELKAERSSTKRASLLAKKIKELEGAKATSGKEATRQLNEQIADLNRQLRAEKDSINGIRTEYEGKLRAKDMGYAKRDLLVGYKTIHDGMDAETRNIIINAIIDKNMKSKGLQWEIDNNGNFVIQTKEGNNAFTDDNRQLTPKVFLDKVMADEKLLVVSDNNNNQQQQQQQQQNQNRNNNQNNFGQNGNNNNNGGNNRNNFNQNQNNGGGNNGGNTVLLDLIKKSQADLANTSNSASLF